MVPRQIDRPVHVPDRRREILRLRGNAHRRRGRFHAEAAAGDLDRVAGAEAVAADGVGNVYIADSGNNKLRQIMADGTIVTLAGGPPTLICSSAHLLINGRHELFESRQPSARDRELNPPE